MDLVFEFGGGAGAKTHKGVRHAVKTGHITRAHGARLRKRLVGKGKIGDVQHLDAGKAGKGGGKRKPAAAQKARPKKTGRKAIAKQKAMPKKAGKAKKKISTQM